MIGLALAALALPLGVSRPAPAMRPPLVVVDPGHGGKDPGGGAGGRTEDAINLAVAVRVARLLRVAGYRVLVTRGADCSPWVLAAHRPPCRVNLKRRVELAVRGRASLFVSLHCDTYADGSVHGPRTYYDAGSVPGKALATSLQARLDPLRQKPLPPIAADYYVLRHLEDKPAALVELGYLSNASDRALLQGTAYQDRIARAIADGVLAFARQTALCRAQEAMTADGAAAVPCARGRG